ncbi:MAG: hypothetical protein ACI8Q1_002414 [Parvicella sp.]|jgi:hypothetical protein
MKNFLVISIFSITVLSCVHENSNPESNEKVKIESVDIASEVEVEILEDSIQLTLNEIEIDISQTLKFEEVIFTNFYKNKKSFVVSDPDSLATYQYINGLFELEQIDSVKFYRSSPSKNHQPYGSPIVIYSSNNEFVTNSLNTLNSGEQFRKILMIFKPGGIAFGLDNNLCLFPWNTCSRGIKEVQRLDSIIKTEVFDNQPFHRLHSGCGMGKMKVITD